MGTLTGTYLLPDGSPEVGTVTFRLTARVVNTDTNIYTEGPIGAVLDGTGSFAVDLVAVDDPGLAVEGTLSYEVVEHVTSRPSTAYYITPLGDGPWQIEDLVWYDAPPDVAVIPVPGPQGEKGDKGDPGTAATVDAGTTTTGPPGSQASVVNSGNTTAAVFDFTVPQGPQGEQGIPGPSGGVNAYAWNWGGTSIADPGTGRIAVNGSGNSPRVLSISKTDADGGARDLLLLLPGDTITITDDPGGPITGWARYALTGDPIDRGTWVELAAIRTDASGTPSPPAIGTRLRVIASLASGGDLYPQRTEVNVLPLAQVATWSALPPATPADVGRRIRVTGGLGRLVALGVADPTPRWIAAPESDTGWRDVTNTFVNDPTQPLVAARGLTVPAGLGHIFMRRRGSQADLYIGNLALLGDGSRSRETYIGPNWQNTGWWWRVPGAGNDSRSYGAASLRQYGYFPAIEATLFARSQATSIGIHAQSILASDNLYGRLTWTAEEIWPTTAP